MSPRTLSTIEQALRTDQNLQLQIQYDPYSAIFCGFIIKSTNPTSEECYDLEIEVKGSNIGGVLEQLAREMLEKYLSNEISTENNNVLPNDRS